MSGSVHTFDFELGYSLKAGDGLWPAYRARFPHALKYEGVTDLVLQRRGVDKIVTFENGRRLYFDEKIRRHDYGDFLLEEYSNFEHKKLGWLNREKYTDYIVYAVLDGGQVVYFLPFLLLQSAWCKHYRKWLARYGRNLADNGTYRTSSICVPRDVVFAAMNEPTIER